jgi:hypothetical protein
MGRCRKAGWAGTSVLVRSRAKVAGSKVTDFIYELAHFKRREAMEFRPLHKPERTQLLMALRGNADSGQAILIDRRDTSFVGTADDVADEEVITAIKSVPCHY